MRIGCGQLFFSKVLPLKARLLNVVEKCRPFSSVTCAVCRIITSSGVPSEQAGFFKVIQMAEFQFHGELFELRAMVMESLAENGFVWLSDFGSVDLAHDIFGLEVTGIREEDQATQIQELLIQVLPGWNFRRNFYEDQNLGEIGWKVIVSRDPENFDDQWQTN
jgi:hypothetical protein